MSRKSEIRWSGEPYWYDSKVVLPSGPGAVLAYSTPSGKTEMINWRYVFEHPDIYTRWRLPHNGREQR